MEGVVMQDFNNKTWISMGGLQLHAKISHKYGIGTQGILKSGWLWCCFIYHRFRFFEIWWWISPRHEVGSWKNICTQ